MRPCPKCSDTKYLEGNPCSWCGLMPDETKKCPGCEKLILKANTTCPDCEFASLSKTCPSCEELIYLVYERCPHCKYDFKSIKFKNCPICGVKNVDIKNVCSKCAFDFKLQTITDLIKSEIENAHDLFISKLIDDGQYKTELMKIVQKHLGEFKSSYAGTRKYVLSFFKKMEGEKLLNEVYYKNISGYILTQFDSGKAETEKAKELKEDKKPKPPPKSNQLNVSAGHSPPKPVQSIQEQSGIRTEFGIHGSAIIKDSPDAEVYKPSDATFDKSRNIQNEQTQPDKPLFLNISPARLILLSIASMSLYEAYWIYKNWRYIKERDGLNIRPFWRGIFGIFYCHSLLRRIHEDKDACAVQKPTFSARGLATGWVILLIFANIVGRAPSIEASIIAAFFPSFLCLVPVQNYINSVTERRNPSIKMYGWSLGHFVCLVFGLIIWAVLLIGIGAEI